MSKLELFKRIQPSQGELMPFDSEGEDIQLLQDTHIDLYVSPEQVDELLKIKESEFDEKAFKLLKSKLQKDVIQAITSPLGLGQITTTWDKEGGAVDTIHNVRQDVFATDSAEHTCQDVQRDYQDKDVQQGYRYKNDRYNERHREANEQAQNHTLRDGYTGKLFEADAKGKVNKDQEHIVAAKRVHDNYDNDNGRKLAGVKTEDLANLDENITFTSSTVNQSKKDRTVDEYLSTRRDNIVDKEKDIVRLEQLQAEGTLSPKQERDLRNAKKYVKAHSDVDPKRMKRKEEKAQQALEDEINDKYYRSQEFARNTATAAASEGGRMALQQLMGSVLVELFSSIIYEVKDAYKHGRCQDSILADIKLRCKRVVGKVVSKWKEHAAALGEGFLAGVLSSIVTTIINTFITSAKRVARLLREGFNSVLRSFRTIILRPEGTTMADAEHEAVKVMFSGGILCGAILLEEAIEKAISTVVVLTPIATMLTMVLTGAITALTMILVSLLFDKLDMFGAMEAKRSDYVSESLTGDLRKELDRFEAITSNRTSLIDMC